MCLLWSTSYDSFLDALWRRKEATAFSCAELNERSGLSSGYVEKIFSPRRLKKLGPMSFSVLLSTLGLKILIVCGEAPTPQHPKNFTQDRSKRRAGQPTVVDLPRRENGSHPEIPA